MQESRKKQGEAKRATTDAKYFSVILGLYVNSKSRPHIIGSLKSFSSENKITNNLLSTMYRLGYITISHKRGENLVPGFNPKGGSPSDEVKHYIRWKGQAPTIDDVKKIRIDIDEQIRLSIQKAEEKKIEEKNKEPNLFNGKPQEEEKEKPAPVHQVSPQLVYLSQILPELIDTVKRLEIKVDELLTMKTPILEIQQFAKNF